MLKSDIKLGIYLNNRQTGKIYRVRQRMRKTNKRSGWHFYILELVTNTNMHTIVKYRIIRKYFKIDKSAQILYGK